MGSKVLLFSIFLIGNNLFGQANHVWNNGFENGPSGAPNFPAQVIGLISSQTTGPTDWLCEDKESYSGTGVRLGSMHSPDWYGPIFPNADAIISGAQEGVKYIGMAHQEMIQQNILPLEPDRVYILSMYIQITDYVAGGNIFSANNGFLQVFLSDRRLHYNATDMGNPCNPGNNEFDGNFGEDYTLIKEFELSKTMYPIGSGWHKIYHVFKAPSDHNSWLSMQVGRINISSDIGRPCSGDMNILIDDITLQDLCELPCLPPSAFLPIEYSSWGDGLHPQSLQNAGLTGPDSYNFTYPDGSVVFMSPFHVFIKNAMFVEFIVKSTTAPLEQNIQLRDHSFSPITLNDPVYGNFFLQWQGDNSAHNLLGLTDGFPIFINMWNCYESFTVNGNVTLFIGAPLSIPFEETMFRDYSIPTGCCRKSSRISDREIHGDFEDHSEEFTLIGSNVLDIAPLIDHGVAYFNRPVDVFPSARVNLFSESEIILSDGVTIQSGALFEAQIEDCGNLDDYRISNNRLRDKLEFSINNPNTKFVGIQINPNPTTGIVKVKNGNAIFTSESSIQVIDQLGRVIWNSSNLKNQSEIEIDLTSYAKGLYFIKVIDSGRVELLRLVKD